MTYVLGVLYLALVYDVIPLIRYYIHVRSKYRNMVVLGTYIRMYVLCVCVLCDVCV